MALLSGNSGRKEAPSRYRGLGIFNDDDKNRGNIFVDAAGACVTAVGRTNNDDLHECWDALFQATEAISAKASVPKGKGVP